MDGDDVEACGFEDPLQVARPPAVRAQDCVVERPSLLRVEVAEEQRASGPTDHAREFGQWGGNAGRLVMDDREPRQDTAQGGIRFVDRLDALDAESDLWVVARACSMNSGTRSMPRMSTPRSARFCVQWPGPHPASMRRPDAAAPHVSMRWRSAWCIALTDPRRSTYSDARCEYASVVRLILRGYRCRVRETIQG